MLSSLCSLLETGSSLQKGIRSQHQSADGDFMKRFIEKFEQTEPR